MDNQSQDVAAIESKEQLPEYSKNGRLIGPKYEAFDILRQQGLSQNRAAQAIGLSKQSGSLIARKLDRKYDLTSKKYIKLASDRLKNILKCEPYGVMDKIKDSTVLQAAQMVYDRVQPLIQRSINLNALIDIHPVDLSDYLDAGPVRAVG